MFRGVTPISTAFPSAATTSLSLNTALVALPSLCTRPNSGWSSVGSNPAGVAAIAPLAKSIRYQKCTAIKIIEMPGVEQPRLEVVCKIFVCQNPLAVDLVFERGLFKPPRPGIVLENLQEIIGAEIAHGGF